MLLLIDDEGRELESPDDAIKAIRTLAWAEHGEVWLDLGDEDSPKLGALISGEVGWMMFMRAVGDAGFATRNPASKDSSKLRFRLANGQVDEYPAAWCYPIPELVEAFVQFATTGERPTNVSWDD